METKKRNPLVAAIRTIAFVALFFAAGCIVLLLAAGKKPDDRKGLRRRRELQRQWDNLMRYDGRDQTPGRDDDEELD